MGRMMGGGWKKTPSGLVDNNGYQIPVTPGNASPTKKPMRLGIAAHVTLPVPAEVDEDDPSLAGPGTHGINGQPLFNAPPGSPVLPPPAIPRGPLKPVPGIAAALSRITGTNVQGISPAPLPGSSPTVQQMEVFSHYAVTLLKDVPCDDEVHKAGEEAYVCRMPGDALYLGCPDAANLCMNSNAKEGVDFTFVGLTTAPPAAQTAGFSYTPQGGPTVTGQVVVPYPPGASDRVKNMRLGVAEPVTLLRTYPCGKWCQQPTHQPGEEVYVMRMPDGRMPMFKHSHEDAMLSHYAQEGVDFAFPSAAPVKPALFGWGGQPNTPVDEKPEPLDTCMNCGQTRTGDKMVCLKCLESLGSLQPQAAATTVPAPQPAPVLAVKTQPTGNVKFYWQYDAQSSKDMGGTIFVITPKKYFDKHGVLDDSHFNEKDIPDGFSNEMESVFSYDGTQADGEAVLRADPLFEEKVLVAGQAAPVMPAGPPSVTQMINATSGKNFKAQKDQLLKEFAKINKELVKALEDGGIVAEDETVRIMLDEDALREWANPEKDEDEDYYGDEEEEKKPINEVIMPKIDPVKWLVKSAIRRVFPKGDVEVMSGEVYLIHQV